MLLKTHQKIYKRERKSSTKLSGKNPKTFVDCDLLIKDQKSFLKLLHGIDLKKGIKVIIKPCVW